MTLKAGIHEMTQDEYFADPAPQASLSATGIKVILSSTMRHFQTISPKLTEFPDAVRRRTKALDLGNIAHGLILGKGGDFCVIDPTTFTNKDGSQASDFRNKEASNAKKAAETMGLIVIDPATNYRAEQSKAWAVKSLEARYGAWPIGESEQCMLWQMETSEGPIWCRALVDHNKVYHPTKTVRMLDVKSKEKPMSNQALQNAIQNDGWDVQAAFYMMGAEALYPGYDVTFEFAIVETVEPFATRIESLSETYLSMARARIEVAAAKFAKCMRTGTWPGHPVNSLPLEPPDYLVTRFEYEMMIAASAEEHGL